MLQFENLADKFLKIYLAEQEIGCLEYTLAADEAQIIDIVITEKYRSQGYGTKLLNNFIDLVRNKYSYIILEVRASNILAINLYKKCGFKQIDIRKNYYNKPKEDALVLKKELFPVPFSSPQ